MIETLQTYKVVIISGLVLLAVGYGTGRYLQPNKVETKVEQVVKEVEVVKRDVVIKERIVHAADGSTVTERVTEDKSTETTNKDSKTKESNIVTNQKSKWLVSGGAGLTTGAQGVYTGMVQYRALGPFFVGGQAVVGPGHNMGLVTVGMEF